MNGSRACLRVALVALVAFAPTLLGCPPDKRPACDPTTERATTQKLCNPHSVVLVRHAEKSQTDTPDPELSPRGRVRAQRLGVLLSKSNPTRLVATEYKRTQETLAPLSERTGKPVEVRSAARAIDLVRELRAAPPGSTTVVATHSNVLPMLVSELGGGALRDLDENGMLGDDDYARVLVLSVGCSASTSILELSSD